MLLWYSFILFIFTLLSECFRKGNLKVVKMLIEKGADVNSVSRRQMDPEKFGKPLFICDTPLICAVAGGHLDVVQALVGAGADISFKVRELDET